MAEFSILREETKPKRKAAAKVKKEKPAAVVVTFTDADLAVKEDADVITTQITRPLLAADVKDATLLSLPLLATPKVDGIRALRIGESLLSRSFKPIRNETIRKLISELLPEGSDGEILPNGEFSDVSSIVMSASKGKDFKDRFKFYWFDYVKGDPNVSYTDRVQDMKDYIEKHPEVLQHPQAEIIPLFPTLVENLGDLETYEKKVLEDNFEGVMLRKPDGKYKMGRSGLKEGILLKMKRFTDAEATIVGVLELNHNGNEKELDAFGGSKRSTKKEGLSGAGKLGALQVMNDAGEKFKIGSGFTDQMRKDYWKESSSLIGKIVKYKYFEVGSKDAPRFPIYIGLRNAEDMGSPE